MTTPIEAIEILKTLFDKELITSNEYDSRRSRILDGLVPTAATAQFTLGGISELGIQVEHEEKTGSAFVEALPNFYKVRVPKGGRAKVVIGIEALEKPTDDFNDRARREYDRLSARIPEIEGLLAEMEKPDFVHTPTTEAERQWLELELRGARLMLAHLEETRDAWDRT